MKYVLLTHSGRTAMSKKTVLAAALVAVSIVRATAADATVTINITENGPDVLAAASGTLDLTGMSLVNVGIGGPATIDPALGVVIVGSSALISTYTGLTGPSFGAPIFTTTTTTTGFYFGIQPSGCGNPPLGCVWVPPSYVSGSPVSSTATFSGQTFATMGLTPGQYTFST